MTGRRDSDTASFLSTNTDPISSPSDGYFSNRAHPQEMFIDTEAANKGAKVRVEAASPRSATRYSQETTPLLSSFVGHGPPPSYLEATTPNPWNARSSGDEAARLLAFDGRISPAPLADPRDSEHKDWAYRRRSFREHWSRKRLLKWGAAILLVIILAAILAAVTHSKKEVFLWYSSQLGMPDSLFYRQTQSRFRLCLYSQHHQLSHKKTIQFDGQHDAGRTTTLRLRISSLARNQN